MDLVQLLANPSGQPIRLYHGASQASAAALNAGGVESAAAASAGGTGEFWATTDPNDAEIFALVNPQGPPCAVFSFELTDRFIHGLLSSNPPQAVLHQTDVIEFMPQSFAALNKQMRSKQIRSLP